MLLRYCKSEMVVNRRSTLSRKHLGTGDRGTVVQRIVTLELNATVL